VEGNEILDRSDPGDTKGRRPPLVRILVVLLLLGVVGIATWALQGGIAPSRGAPRIGARAPNFTIENVDGTTVSLSDYRGKTVILNFWATWCLPCRSEMPAIEATARSRPDVVVLAVDVQEGVVPVRDYTRELGLTFKPLLDTSGQVTSLYHVDVLPTSFFIGPDGTIRAMNVGPMDQPMIDRNVGRAT
jgi:peroxiredoxin